MNQDLMLDEEIMAPQHPFLIKMIQLVQDYINEKPEEAIYQVRHPGLLEELVRYADRGQTDAQIAQRWLFHAVKINKLKP